MPPLDEPTRQQKVGYEPVHGNFETCANDKTQTDKEEIADYSTAMARGYAKFFLF